MRLLLRIVARLITAAVGYVAASLAAGITIVLAVTGWASGYTELPLATIASHAIYTGGALAAFVVVLAFPPTVIMVLVGELFAIRSSFYYIVVGGLIGALGYVGATDFGMREDAGGNAEELFVFLAAGLVGGAAYWLVAGRDAGLRPTPRAREEPSSAPDEQQPQGEGPH